MSSTDNPSEVLSFKSLLIAPLAVSGTTSTVTAFAQQFWHGFYERTLDTSFEQYTKLGWMMNYFEEVMFGSLDVIFNPRARQIILGDTMTDANATEINTQGEAYITMIADTQDVVVRPILAEYFQVRMQSDAQGGSITNAHSLRIAPKQLDAVMNDNAGTLGPSTTNVKPVPASWQSTKVTNIEAGTGLVLNMYSGTGANAPVSLYFALKIYLFCPFITAGAGSANLGTLTYIPHYKFRKPDYRAILGTPTVIETDEIKASRLERQRLNKERLLPMYIEPTLTKKQELLHKVLDPTFPTPQLDKEKRVLEAIEDLANVAELNQTHQKKKRLA